MFQDDNTDGRKNYPRNNVNDGTESNNDQSTSEEGNLAAMFFMFILLFSKIKYYYETYVYIYIYINNTFKLITKRCSYVLFDFQKCVNLRVIH